MLTYEQWLSHEGNIIADCSRLHAFLYFLFYFLSRSWEVTLTTRKKKIKEGLEGEIGEGGKKEGKTGGRQRGSEEGGWMINFALIYQDIL